MLRCISENRLGDMRVYKFFLSSFLILSIPAIAEIDYSQVPEKWREMIRNEFENVYERKTEAIPVKDRNIIQITTIEIPENEVEGILSKYVDANTTKYSQVEKNGKKYIRFFFDEAKIPETLSVFLKSHKYSASIKKEFLGIKMQGHSSYFIWHPSDKSYEPVALRLKQLTNDNTYGHNSLSSLEDGIRNNDFLETTLRESDDKITSFLPERFAAQMVYTDKIKYSYTVRTLTSPVGNKSTKWFGLHGLLSKTHLLKELADKKKMSVDQWIKEIYIPKLAQFSANINFNHGFYVAGHTQNLLAYVDRETGDLANIGFKDLPDILIDPFTRLSQGKPVNLDPSVGDHSIVYWDYLDGSYGKAVPGYNLALYTGQSVIDMEPDYRKKAELMLEFIDEYKKNVERLTGKKINFSDSGNSYLVQLKEYVTRKDTDFPEAENPLRQYGSPRAVLGEIQNDLYLRYLEDITPKLNNENLGYKQKTLSKIFKKYFYNEQLCYFVVGGRMETVLNLGIGKYGFDGKGIFQYDPKTKQIISYAYNLSPEDLTKVKASRVIIKSIIYCLKGMLSKLR